MDNLELIWKQLDELNLKLDQVIQPKKDFSIYDKLKKEQAIRRQYNPLLILLIVAFPIIFWQFLLPENPGSYQIVGLIMLTGSGVAIALFSQIVKMPLQEFAYDQSSIEFLEIVKVKLDQSKKMLILGIVLQIILLTIGLYCLIFNAPLSEVNFGYLIGLIGLMASLGGVALGSAIAGFNQHYKSIYQKIEDFRMV